MCGDGFSNRPEGHSPVSIRRDKPLRSSKLYWICHLGNIGARLRAEFLLYMRFVCRYSPLIYGNLRTFLLTLRSTE